MDSQERAEIIAQAMKRKFGALLDWERPKLLHTFGPNNLGEVDVFEKNLEVMRVDALTTLEELTEESFKELSTQLSDAYRIAEGGWLALLGEKIDRLSRFKPPAIAYGFGHPKYSVDFKYWGRMPNLSLHEVTMISVGAAPNSMSEETISELLRVQKSGKKLWSAQDFLLQQHETLRRYFHHTGWGYEPEPTSKIKNWIDQMELPTHPDFYAALERRHDQKATPLESISSRPMTTQERDTLLKLIAAMACEQYSYDPRQERSAVPARIKEDIELVGLSMNDKTIRKWLKAATNLVAQEYWRGE